MKSFTENPKSALLLASIMLLPLILMNIIASNEIEPFFSYFKIETPDGFTANPIGFIVLIASLLLIPLVALIAVKPWLRKGADKKSKFLFVNITFAAFLILVFITFVGAWISEIVHG